MQADHFGLLYNASLIQKNSDFVIRTEMENYLWVSALQTESHQIIGNVPDGGRMSFFQPDVEQETAEKTSL